MMLIVNLYLMVCVGVIWGMSVGEFAMALGSLLALLVAVAAIVVNIKISNKNQEEHNKEVMEERSRHDKEMLAQHELHVVEVQNELKRHNEELEIVRKRHIIEIRLDRLQREFIEMNAIGFDLENNGGFKYVLDLRVNMVVEGYYERYRDELRLLNAKINKLKKRYLVCLYYYKLPMELELPYKDGKRIFKLLDLINEYDVCLDKITSLIIFFMGIVDLDEGSRRRFIMYNMGRVELSPVKMLDDHDNVIGDLTFERYCEEREFDYAMIRNDIGDYLKSTMVKVRDVNGLIQNFTNEIRQIIVAEKENLEGQLAEDRFD